MTCSTATLLNKSHLVFILLAAVALCSLQPARAEIVCSTVRPDSNVTTLWDPYSYTNIDDFVFKPNTPSSDAVIAGGDDDFEEQIWGFSIPSATDIASVTAVHAHIHANQGNVTGDHPTLRIKAGGVWSSTQTAELEDGWYSLTFYGTWDLADFDQLELGIDPQQVNNSEEINLDAIYCEVCGEIESGTQ